MSNLNQSLPENPDDDDFQFNDNSIETKSGINVHFRNLEDKLIQCISEADAVFGAVAWLTSNPILNALTKVDNVSIIVQKEDFLRPDLDSPKNWKEKLRKQYSKLKCEIPRFSIPNILASASYCNDPTLDPIRCVGNHNKEKNPAFPRMHNKFLVFCRVKHLPPDKEGWEVSPEITPYAVWTGSFNLTYNATRSLENALYITVPDIVKAYFDEYGQIAALSEPLDWTSTWMAPEWRIGS